ncbi:hypothetical protein GH816_02060 [Betaproteobacteria bacterium LSUCC0115]|nr:hypothetical protein [Burkholderiales bacterium LSUCC0115]
MSTDRQVFFITGPWSLYRSPPFDDRFHPAFELSPDVFVRTSYEFYGDFSSYRNAIDVLPNGPFAGLSAYIQWENRSTGEAGEVHVYRSDFAQSLGSEVFDMDDPYISARQDWVIGGLGADQLGGYAGSDVLEGGGGDDVLLGDGRDEYQSELGIRLPRSITDELDGNDRMIGGAGDDQIDGGAGIDIANFSGKWSQYRVELGSTVYVHALESDEGTDTIINVERLVFEDVSLAIDFDATAASTAKIIGALWGASALDDHYLVGLGLALFDSGLDEASVAEIAITARGIRSNTDLCETLWENLVGSSAPEGALDAFIERLDSFETTRSDFLLEVADHPLNIENIDLVGLAQTGLEYL